MRKSKLVVVLMIVALAILLIAFMDSCRRGSYIHATPTRTGHDSSQDEPPLKAPARIRYVSTRTSVPHANSATIRMPITPRAAVRDNTFL